MDYRHITREMERRIAAAVDERIYLVQRTALEHLASKGSQVGEMRLPVLRLI